MTAYSPELPGLLRIRKKFIELQIERHDDLEVLLDEMTTQDVDDNERLRECKDILHKIAGTAGSLGLEELGNSARDTEYLILGHLEERPVSKDKLMNALDAFLDVSLDVCLAEGPRSL